MPVQQPIGTAVLYVSSSVRPEVVEAFNTWCDTVHHFDTMRIDGFLSLRRFELVEGLVEDGVVEYPLLTLYQVERSEDADFSTPSYAHHSATYTPPPPGVVDGIQFERAVYERDGGSGAGTQPVGSACITLIGTPGPWIADVQSNASRSPGVLNSYVVTGDERSVLLIDVELEQQGRELFARLAPLDHAGRRRSLQLFRQVFPATGVLLRDREFRAQST
jgi:hypothetical protein